MALNRVSLLLLVFASIVKCQYEDFFMNDDYSDGSIMEFDDGSDLSEAVDDESMSNFKNFNEPLDNVKLNDFYPFLEEDAAMKEDNFRNQFPSYNSNWGLDSQIQPPSYMSYITPSMIGPHSSFSTGYVILCKTRNASRIDKLVPASSNLQVNGIENRAVQIPTKINDVNSKEKQLLRVRSQDVPNVKFVAIGPKDYIDCSPVRLTSPVDVPTASRIYSSTKFLPYFRDNLFSATKTSRLKENKSTKESHFTKIYGTEAEEKHGIDPTFRPDLIPSTNIKESTAKTIDYSLIYKFLTSPYNFADPKSPLSVSTMKSDNEDKIYTINNFPTSVIPNTHVVQKQSISYPRKYSTFRTLSSVDINKYIFTRYSLPDTTTSRNLNTYFTQNIPITTKFTKLTSPTNLNQYLKPVLNSKPFQMTYSSTPEVTFQYQNSYGHGNKNLLMSSQSSKTPTSTKLYRDEKLDIPLYSTHMATKTSKSTNEGRNNSPMDILEQYTKNYATFFPKYFDGNEMSHITIPSKEIMDNPKKVFVPYPVTVTYIIVKSDTTKSYSNSSTECISETREKPKTTTEFYQSNPILSTLFAKRTLADSSYFYKSTFNPLFYSRISTYTPAVDISTGQSVLKKSPELINSSPIFDYIKESAKTTSNNVQSQTFYEFTPDIVMKIFQNKKNGAISKDERSTSTVIDDDNSKITYSTPFKSHLLPISYRGSNIQFVMDDTSTMSSDETKTMTNVKTSMSTSKTFVPLPIVKPQIMSRASPTNKNAAMNQRNNMKLVKTTKKPNPQRERNSPKLLARTTLRPFRDSSMKNRPFTQNILRNQFPLKSTVTPSKFAATRQNSAPNSRRLPPVNFSIAVQRPTSKSVVNQNSAPNSKRLPPVSFSIAVQLPTSKSVVNQNSAPNSKRLPPVSFSIAVQRPTSKSVVNQGRSRLRVTEKSTRSTFQRFFAQKPNISSKSFAARSARVKNSGSRQNRKPGKSRDSNREKRIKG